MSTTICENCVVNINCGMKVCLVLLAAIVCLGCHFVLAAKNHRSAAVPKKKSSHGIGGSIFGSRALKGLMRDVKMTFSSPLELVALQVRRAAIVCVVAHSAERSSLCRSQDLTERPFL